MERRDITKEMERARADFHQLLDSATSAELRAPTHGTKWTNEQLLFHMLFGYLLVRNLLPLVKTLSRLPAGISRGFAAALNAATRPFHQVNFIGSLGGARVLGHERMERLMDHVVASLQRSLSRAREESLDRGMHFPVGWDPYFYRLHDSKRGLPLRHPALRSPPTPTDPGIHRRGTHLDMTAKARGAIESTLHRTHLGLSAESFSRLGIRQSDWWRVRCRVGAAMRPPDSRCTPRGRR
jgi:hypothetical protein